MKKGQCVGLERAECFEWYIICSIFGVILENFGKFRKMAENVGECMGSEELHEND